MTTLRRLIHPESGRRVGVATDGTTILVELGDLAAVVERFVWTPMMATAALPHIARCRFVPVPVARAWARDLDIKQHKAPALSLHRLLDWAQATAMREVSHGRAA